MVVRNGVIAIAAIKSDVVDTLIRSEGVVADGVIPRIPHQGDCINKTLRRCRRLEVVVRNGVIARAAIKSDGDYYSTSVEGVTTDGITANTAIKYDAVYIITRSEAVATDGVVAISTIKCDAVYIITRSEGVATDGVVAIAAMKIDDVDSITLEVVVLMVSSPAPPEKVMAVAAVPPERLLSLMVSLPSPP